jgi:hypothetical protein
LVWLNIEIRESERLLFHDLLFSGLVARVVGRGDPAGLEKPRERRTRFENVLMIGNRRCLTVLIQLECKNLLSHCRFRLDDL